MKTGYKVGNVMTQKPIVIGLHADISSCASLMQRKHVGAVLVTEGKKIHGIITEKDIVRKSFGLNTNPLELKVHELMESDFISVTPDKDVHDALMMMTNMSIRHLPVIEDDVLVGLITQKDILKLEPQLFELIAHQIELREEERKPINNFNPNEGICNLCGEYTNDITKHESLVLCPICAKDEGVHTKS